MISFDEVKYAQLAGKVFRGGTGRTSKVKACGACITFGRKADAEYSSFRITLSDDTVSKMAARAGDTFKLLFNIHSNTGHLTVYALAATEGEYGVALRTENKNRKSANKYYVLEAPFRALPEHVRREIFRVGATARTQEPVDLKADAGRLGVELALKA